jgi:N-formylglutamate deformylase
VTDDEFVRAFEGCEISNADFHHRDHVRLAWLYLRRYGIDADHKLAAGIQKFAAHYGKLDKYHQTITIAWMRLVAPAASLGTFEEVTASYPRLLDKNCLREFYSDEVLFSDAARESFIEPDKQSFSVVK